MYKQLERLDIHGCVLHSLQKWAVALFATTSCEYITLSNQMPDLVWNHSAKMLTSTKFDG
jgi:hypothetical protein